VRGRGGERTRRRWRNSLGVDDNSAEEGSGEAAFSKCGGEVSAGDARNPAHGTIVARWIPPNPRVCSGAPSTPKHRSLASRMRCVISSRNRAWVPGCGRRGPVERRQRRSLPRRAQRRHRIGAAPGSILAFWSGLAAKAWQTGGRPCPRRQGRSWGVIRADRCNLHIQSGFTRDKGERE